jgi:hypothetical protein
MTNHAELDRVLDSLLAEHNQAADDRPQLAAKPQADHWLRKTMKTGPVALPPPSRR